MRVAIASCRVLPEPDPDQGPLLAALAEAGVRAEVRAWDERPGAARPLADFDLCVLRSTWNYPLDPHGFVAWLERAAVATRVVNPVETVRWNLHKRYLLELERAGVPIVPTFFVEHGAPRGASLGSDLAAELAARGWDDVVVKPAVSAASFRTRRFRGATPEACAFLEELAGERDAMVQPYLSSVEREGERALVWIDGEWTHAIEKRPRFAGDDESVSPARALEPAERRLAERVLATLGARAEGLLYARLDLIPAVESEDLLVSELELVEPSLFLVQHPPALARLVAAIARP